VGRTHTSKYRLVSITSRHSWQLLALSVTIHAGNNRGPWIASGYYGGEGGEWISSVDLENALVEH
jgi:hypothetical protein